MMQLLWKLTYLIRRHSGYPGFFLATLLLAACEAGVTTNPSPEIPALATDSIHPTSSLTATRVKTIPPTPTLTLTQTPTHVFLPRWTSLPTLTDYQAAIKFQEWLQGSTDCRLPCWAEITPAKTNWEQAKQILSPVVEIRTLELNLPCNFGPCNVLEWLKRGDLYIRGSISSDSNELIDTIVIDFSEPIPLYRVDKILNQYGLPRQVFLDTTYNAVLDPNNFPFYITLAYPDRNFIVQYIWVASRRGEDTIGCIQDQSTWLLVDSSINDQWSDKQLVDRFRRATDSKFIHPLEDVTDMTIEQFYEEFKSISGNECIVTPGKYWP